MAQTFETWTDETAARDVVYDKTKTNFETIRSSWSGTSFPENPVAGQPCYRTDEDKLYYWNGTEWGEKGGGSDQYVTTYSPQTITGSKEFTQPAAGMSIELVADTNQQTVPATATVRQLGLYKNSTNTKGDGFTSWLQAVRGSDGRTATEFYTRRFLEGDSQEIINYLSVSVTPDGVPVAYTRIPPIGVSGEEIITAGWFNSKMQVVSALPANPDPNVFYVIPE